MICVFVHMLNDMCICAYVQRCVYLCICLKICVPHLKPRHGLCRSLKIHCKTLQHTAPHCNKLPHPKYMKPRHDLRRLAVWIYTTTHYNTLQHTLHRTATHCNVLHLAASPEIPEIAAWPRSAASATVENCTAEHCNTVHRNTLHHTATPKIPETAARPLLPQPPSETAQAPVQHVVLFAATKCNTLQHAATRCNTLLHTWEYCDCVIYVYALREYGIQCNTLQHIAAHFTVLRQCDIRVCIAWIMRYSMQHAATYWSTRVHAVSYPATHCNTLHHTVPHCSRLQQTAADCSRLQQSAAECSRVRQTAPAWCTWVIDHACYISGPINNEKRRINDVYMNRTTIHIWKETHTPIHIWKETYMSNNKRVCDVCQVLQCDVCWVLQCDAECCSYKRRNQAVDILWQDTLLSLSHTHIHTPASWPMRVYVKSHAHTLTYVYTEKHVFMKIYEKRPTNTCEKRHINKHMKTDDAQAHVFGTWLSTLPGVWIHWEKRLHQHTWRETYHKHI